MYTPPGCTAGTPLGDPIEVGAAAAVFGNGPEGGLSLLSSKVGKVGVGRLPGRLFVFWQVAKAVGYKQTRTSHTTIT